MGAIYLKRIVVNPSPSFGRTNSSAAVSSPWPLDLKTERDQLAQSQYGIRST